MNDFEIKPICDRLDGIISELKKNTSIITVTAKPLEFFTCISDSKEIVGTANQIDLESPQFEFQNPRKIDTLIKSIAGIGDEIFLSKCKIVIMLEGMKIYETKSINTLTLSGGFSLSFPTGIILHLQESLKIYISNVEDNDKFHASIEVCFSE